MNRYIFVGECRSATAVQRGWTWADGHLAAKPLFEALMAMGVAPSAQAFMNVYRDPPKHNPNLRHVNAAAIGAMRASDRLIVALGKRVSAELRLRGIPHVAVVHPAARGRIRKRERYIAHVVSVLGRS